MSFTGVLRPGHVSIRVLDLEEGVNHYGNVLGLHETGRDDQGRVYFKAWDEHDHHSVVLREADTPGMDYMGFRVASNDDLARLEKAVEDYGLTVERIPAGEHLATGERIRFRVPTGHQIELYAEKEQVGNMLPLVNPDPWPDGLKGMSPMRFDHCLLYGPDVKTTSDFFIDVLGFNLAEQIVDGDKRVGAFVTCSNKPHDVAFIEYERPMFHHASFYLESWNDVLKAADIIARNDVSNDIGPTRHGLTRGATIYFFDPSGNRNEVYALGYQYYPDRPTITWTIEEIGKGIFYHDRKLNENFMNVLTEA